MIESVSRRLVRVGDFLRALTGWRRLGVAFAAGLVSALGFAPFNIFPALLVGFAVVVLLIDGMPSKGRMLAAATAAWAFGFGQYTLGMHWIVFAFLVDPVAHAWQIPLVFLFFASLALFQFVAGLVSGAFWRRGIARLFLFAAAYGSVEWLRGHILTGFPWNLPAYSWGASLAVLQSTAVLGAYGLSLLTVLFGAALADLFVVRPRWKLPAVMTGVFVAFFVIGSVRLAVTPTKTVPGVTVRLVQPGIPQAEKYQRRYTLRNWRRLLDLSRAPGNPSIVIWPEAAPPFFLDEQPLALQQIADITANRRVLLTGAIRRDLRDDGTIRYANSFFAFGRDGALLATYDKSHLVPFGEYMPFEKTLALLGLEKLSGIDGGFTPGDGRTAIALPQFGTVTPLICYEILFPGEVTPPQRPDWFANVTDDSWFGPWVGPRQHLLVARIRAIEEGIPLVRSANTGISAVIDPFGRVLQSLGTGEIGFVDEGLPAAIAVTPYSRIGDGLFLVLVCAMVALTKVRSKGK